MFRVVRNLAVPILLGKLFMDSFIQSLFFSEKKIASFDSSLMKICMSQETESHNTDQQQDDTVAIINAEQTFNQKPVRVVRTVALKSLSETSVSVAANAKGLLRIDNFQQLGRTCEVNVAHGVMDVFRRGLYYVIVANT